MMLERIIRQLKRVLLMNSVKQMPKTECKNITEKLNQVYKAEASLVNPQLLNAQLVSIDREVWL